MNLKSFGCSFIFGTDLTDICEKVTPLPSYRSWPALLAKELNANYQCYARPGSGNLQILERILTQCNDNPNDIFVIGWTWIDRYDYLDSNDNRWGDEIILPPNTPWKTIVPVDNSDLAQTYYKKLHSQYQDKLTTLVYMKTAIDTLRQNNIKFIMTYIDDLIFETEWQPNAAISELQKYIQPYTTQFEDKTFLQWSESQCFEISPTLHPLDQAHQAAAEYIMQEIFDKKNTNGPTQQVLS